MAIPCEYLDAGYFRDGVATVAVQGGALLIDKKGKHLFEKAFAYEGPALPVFKGGYCVAATGKNGASALIDAKGRAILSYARDEYAILVGPRYPGLALVRGKADADSPPYKKLKDKKGATLLEAYEIAEPFGDQDFLFFFDSDSGSPRLYDLKKRSVSKPLEASAFTRYTGFHYSFMVGASTLIDRAQDETLMVDTRRGKVLFDNWTSRAYATIMPSGCLYQWDSDTLIDTHGLRVLPKLAK
jgi:hypothetical protein